MELNMYPFPAPNITNSVGMGCTCSASVTGCWLSRPWKDGRLEYDKTNEEVATFYVLFDFHFIFINDCGCIANWSLIKRMQYKYNTIQ